MPTPSIPLDARGVWARPSYSPGGEPGRAAFLAFLDQPVNGDVDLRQEGWPRAAPPAGVTTESIVVAEAPAWAAWVEQVAPTVEDAMASRLRAAPYIAVIKAEVADPRDLGHLQSAWAAARWLCRRGAFLVRDDVGDTWHAPVDVLGLDAFSMAVGFQLRVGEVAPGVVALCTVGMPKVGRREIVLFARPEAVEGAERLAFSVAQELILGRRLASGDRIELAGARFRVDAFVPGFNGPDVALPCAAQPHLLVIEG